VRAWSWAGSDFWKGTAAFFYTWVTVVEVGLQTAGLVCVILSLAMPQQWLERDRLAAVNVAPVIGKDFTGLALSGRF
jgi:hypothetical protein